MYVYQHRANHILLSEKQQNECDCEPVVQAAETFSFVATSVTDTGHFIYNKPFIHFLGKLDKDSVAKKRLLCTYNILYYYFVLKCLSSFFQRFFCACVFLSAVITHSPEDKTQRPNWTGEICFVNILVYSYDFVFFMSRC